MVKGRGTLVKTEGSMPPGGWDSQLIHSLRLQNTGSQALTFQAEDWQILLWGIWAAYNERNHQPFVYHEVHSGRSHLLLWTYTQVLHFQFLSMDSHQRVLGIWRNPLNFIKQSWCTKPYMTSPQLTSYSILQSWKLFL